MNKLIGIAEMLSADIDVMISGLEQRAYNMYEKALTLPRKKKKKLKKRAIQLYNIAMWAKETYTFKF